MPFPHQLAWLIDNPLRRLLVSPFKVAERLELRPEDHVLEVGPGSGYFSRELANRLVGGTLHLLDVQCEMLVKARRGLERRSARVTYTCADVAALPFRSESFDAILAVAVLGETASVRNSLSALGGVLRRGGRLLVHEHIPDPDMIRFGALRDIAQAEGFEIRERWGSRWNYSVLLRRSPSAQRPHSRS